jgi:diguanylate cyclase (GGDEF)-like protein/PAS domain S-box-containing protein
VPELHVIYALVYAVAAAIGLAICVSAWFHRRSRGALPVAFMMLGVTIWSAAAAMFWYVEPISQQIFWSKMRSLGVWMVPVGFLALGLAMANETKWLRPSRLVPISAVMFLVSNAEWPNPGNAFFAYTPVPMGEIVRVVPVPGPLFWVLAGASYALVSVSLFLLVRRYLRSSERERGRAAIMAIGGALILVANLVTQLLSDALNEADLTPIAFLITGILWFGAIVRGGLLDVVSLARNTLFDHMPDGVVVIDENGAVADANSSAVRLLGVPREELLHQPAEEAFLTLVGADRLLAAGEEKRQVLADAFGYLDVAVTPLGTADAEAEARMVTMRDVTQERRAQERLRLVATVFDSASEAIVVALPPSEVDPCERIAEVNDAFCRLTGYTAEELIGAPLDSIRAERDAPEFSDTVREALRTTGEWHGETWQRKADGSAFPVWLAVSVARDENGTPEYIVAVSTDLSDLRNAEEEIEFNATHDALTGLPNRVLFNDRLEQALAQAHRTHGQVAVLLIDLDKFKTVNDTMGHAAGDELLTQVADRARATMRESDTIGRHGGDEFACVLPGLEDSVDVNTVTQRLLETLSAPYEIESREVDISASIGVAVYPADGSDAAALVKHADIAMYSAKTLGRSRVQFYSEELQERLEERVLVEREISNALTENRYYLLYQPQVDLRTGQIIGAEALLRLRRREGGTMQPAEFMGVVGNSDLAVRLGDWVVRKACAELCTFQQIAPDLTMSVNLSARQFREIDVSGLLQDVLPSCHVGPQSLDFEVTEDTLMADPSAASAKLEELRGVVGVRLSLDDIGTGYSSLTYMRMIRASTLKIDRGFISLLPDDSGARAIVRSIIALAEELNASVVAEGPETEEQVRFLRAHGCGFAQGLYFSKPVSADEFAGLLRAGPFELPDVEAIVTEQPEKDAARATAASPAALGGSGRG